MTLASQLRFLSCLSSFLLFVWSEVWHVFGFRWCPCLQSCHMLRAGVFLFFICVLNCCAPFFLLLYLLVHDVKIVFMGTEKCTFLRTRTEDAGTASLFFFVKPNKQIKHVEERPKFLESGMRLSSSSCTPVPSFFWAALATVTIFFSFFNFDHAARAAAL